MDQKSKKNKKTTGTPCFFSLKFSVGLFLLNF